MDEPSVSDDSQIGRDVVHRSDDKDSWKPAECLDALGSVEGFRLFVDDQ